MTKLNFNISLTYSEIFNKNEDVHTLLKQLPLKQVLEIICHFTNAVHFERANEEQQFKILNLWLDRLPETVKLIVLEWIVETKRDGKTNINFFNAYGALKLIQHALIINNNIEKNHLTNKMN